MKVICIDDKVEPDEHIIPGCSLIYGNIYTVAEEVEGFAKHDVLRVQPIKCYILEEIPKPKGLNLFPIKKFVPLSEIDETTFERNYQKELV